ncbi:F-box/FBD/LRR-repeat protein At1g16930-like [Panicum hallii]|uniref:F-box/FBD/LRR-repeat protein At1g16930-like n=1 Tax=Panicum hallii TaxID=206008 RepID=UPI000DF4CD24|nr:F-box/FBD/LRR-repeat protein At1g16930-like [Panicum hallii]
MDQSRWRIAGIQHVRSFSGEDEGTDKALKLAYGSLFLPHPPATPDAPLAAACAAWSGVDRISSLPDEILRNVVARLPVKDAARTGALASRWRSLWRSAPLVFADSNLLQGCRENPLWRPGLEETLGVTNDVSDILAAHPGPFRCVQITCCYLDMNREKIKGWLKLVAGKGVQELAFINRPWPLDLPLPTTLFSCTSLTRLHIGAWKLPSTATLPDAVAFPHLFLTLITMKDQDLAFLLERSPVLEVLTIITSQRDVRLCLASRSLRCLQLGMSCLGDFTVAEAPRLERFFLLMTHRIRGNKFSRIKIGNAPNMRMLGYWPPGQHELQIGNTIIEVSPSTIIPSVKILALQVHFEVRNEVKTVPTFLKCFPNVETLHIHVKLSNLACFFIWHFTSVAPRH